LDNYQEPSYALFLTLSIG